MRWDYMEFASSTFCETVASLVNVTVMVVAGQQLDGAESRR